MSTLENLPVEILELIFLESWNLNLPRASLRLGNALSSKRTKLQLLLQAFSTDNIASHKDRHEEISRVLCTGGRNPYVVLGELQSDILSCRWVTWDFLKIYMETFITRTLLHQFRDLGLPWQDLEHVKDSVVAEYVHSILNQRVKLGIDVSDFCQGEPMLDQDQPSTHEEKLEAIRQLMVQAIQQADTGVAEFVETVKQNWAQVIQEQREAVGIGEVEYWKAIKKVSQQAIQQSKAATGEMELDDEADTATDESVADASKCTDFDVGKHRVAIVATTSDPDWDDLVDFPTAIVTSSLMVRGWQLEDEISKVAVGIIPRTGMVFLGSSLKADDDKDMMRFHHAAWNALKIHGEIPAKLLIGPWSQEKLNFLEATVDSGASVENKCLYETAEQGLMDAIREDNYRAVDLLATESLDATSIGNVLPPMSKGVFVEPSFNSARFTFKYPNENFLDEGPYVTNLFDRRTAKIIPTTEHLKAAIIERPCWRMIVRRILFAESCKIDYCDPDIAEWIEDRDTDGDAKGKWLRYQLDKSEMMQSHHNECLEDMAEMQRGLEEEMALRYSSDRENDTKKESEEDWSSDTDEARSEGEHPQPAHLQPETSMAAMDTRDSNA